MRGSAVHHLPSGHLAFLSQTFAGMKQPHLRHVFAGYTPSRSFLKNGQTLHAAMRTLAYASASASCRRSRFSVRPSQCQSFSTHLVLIHDNAVATYFRHDRIAESKLIGIST